MSLPLHTVSFRYAKHLVTARYARIDDVRPATTEIRSLYFGGEAFSREEAEKLQFGNDSTLWDETDHRCWMDAYGPKLSDLRRMETEITGTAAASMARAAMAE